MPREPSQTAVAEEKSSGGGSHEGINVHGHWTIEVRNVDGTLATHREVENSLQTPNPLSLLLQRNATIGRWSVLVGPVAANASQDPCAPPTVISAQFPNLTMCVITEPNSEMSLHYTSVGTLSVSLVGNNAQQLQLTGAAQAQSSGMIEQVSSYLELCPPNVSPSACNFTQDVAIIGNNIVNLVTQALVSPSIAVLAGQTVSVTVIISFS